MAVPNKLFPGYIIQHHILRVHFFPDILIPQNNVREQISTLVSKAISALIVNILKHCLFDMLVKYSLFQVLFPCYVMTKFQEADLIPYR
jgi:hypothetical protein